MKPIRVVAQREGHYSLKAALLVYSNAARGSYVSSHEIVRGPKGTQLGAGKPLERQGLRRLLEHAGRDVGLRGWISPEVLYVAPDAIAWWRPAAPAPMFFTAGAIAKGAARGVPPHPGLVFAVARGRWYVWALAGDERPTSSTPLHQAPYFNVYDDGSICEGNVEIPRSLAPETVSRFVDVFFESRFTHPNASGLCTYEDGAANLWRDLLAGKHAKFPTQYLLRSTTTLGRELQRILREDVE